MRKKLLFFLISAVMILVIGVTYLYRTHRILNKNTKASLQTDLLGSDIPAPGGNIIKFSDKINMRKWLKNKEHHVYYQLGIPYCSNPTDASLEKLAIFVPAKFMKCRKNKRTETYTCAPNPKTNVGRYSSTDAPVVMPIEAPDYSSISPLSEYRDVRKFMENGFIYVHVGCRGIEHGAPAAVADLKAAIRFIRHNKNDLPTDVESIFVFGYSGGGGLASVLGSSGDSPLYQPYLQEIGALNIGSDAVRGVMAWSPMTNFESANEAYEWNMGYTRKGITENQHELSNRMARAYAEYVNNAGFRDERDRPLMLQYSDRGIYQSGTYYDYVQEVIEDSLSAFIKKTNFPYTPPRDQYHFGQFSSGETKIKGEIDPQGTYLTRRQYLKYLNSRRKWVGYDFVQNIATIRGVDDFIQSFKPATKNIGSFDAFNRQQLENKLFRTDDGQNRHFDELTMKILRGHPKEKEFSEDLIATDRLGITVAQRRNMYSPLYYMLPSSQGFRSSKVAQFWRIRSGINQTETALTTEINLSLAARRYPTVKDVDFLAVWAENHTVAEEQQNDPIDALIQWMHAKLHDILWK